MGSAMKSLNSAASGTVLGSTLPRIATPPLVTGPPGGCECGCALTPATSYGYGVIKFARSVVGVPLDPWEAYAAIHLGELLSDGRPRFRTLLILVARQNGKTTLAKILVLYWLFVEMVGSVLNTSTDRSYAKKFWHQVCAMAEGNEWLAPRVASVRLTISEEMLTTTDRATLVPGDPVQHTFAANNGRAGRSMTLARWLCDELREHTNRDAWDAATNAQNAVSHAQTICITNQGGDSAVVLDSLHKSALRFIETGEGDPRVGLLEWSSPDGADPTDIHALAAANPNMGRPGRVDTDALLGAAMTAKAAGGEELAGFRTEVMCQRVRQLDPAIDPDAWLAGLEVGNLDGVRSRVALLFDVAPDERHATLTAAAVLSDGRVRLEPIAGWDDMRVMRRELAGKVAKIKPQAFGWFPKGPAVAFAALLRKRPGWPPAGVVVEEIKADAPAVCMGLAEQVRAGLVVHSGDPLQDAHVAGAEKLYMPGGLWVFSRKGGHCDAAYAAAGAVHLARTLPPPVGRPRLLVAE
jgi:hypothetical protein